MTDGLILRKAESKDVGEIAALEAAVFTDAWRKDDFTALIGYPDYVFFTVAELNGKVAGYVIARSAADEGEIMNIAVDAKYRRTGIGRRLISGALDALDLNGAAAVYLEVRASNAGALRLYTDAGFEPVGIRRRYYRNPSEDAVVMRRLNDKADGGSCNDNA